MTRKASAKFEAKNEMQGEENDEDVNAELEKPINMQVFSLL